MFMEKSSKETRCTVWIDKDVFRKAKMFVAEFGGTIQGLVTVAVDEGIKTRREKIEKLPIK